MIKDEYGYIINSEQTYRSLTDILFKKESVFFSWTENEGTQLDIFMAYKPKGLTPGLYQRGLTADDLFISIIGIGSCGFSLDTRNLSAGYVGQKLGLHPDSITTIKLTTLIKEIGNLL